MFSILTEASSCALCSILFGILSLQSLLWKWFICWRYILVMISKSSSPWMSQ